MRITPIEVSASPREPCVSGVARWGTTPIEHAIIELRTGDWRVNPNAVLQPGHTCHWVVNAVAVDGGLLADGESLFVVQP